MPDEGELAYRGKLRSTAFKAVLLTFMAPIDSPYTVLATLARDDQDGWNFRPDEAFGPLAEVIGSGATTGVYVFVAAIWFVMFVRLAHRLISPPVFYVYAPHVLPALRSASNPPVKAVESQKDLLVNVVRRLHELSGKLASPNAPEIDPLVDGLSDVIDWAGKFNDPDQTIVDVLYRLEEHVERYRQIVNDVDAHLTEVSDISEVYKQTLDAIRGCAVFLHGELLLGNAPKVVAHQQAAVTLASLGELYQKKPAEPQAEQ